MSPLDHVAAGILAVAISANRDDEENRVKPSRLTFVQGYKIDRLTRSLADFPRMLEVFKCHVDGRPCPDGL